ncbi:hypothetical protein BGZ76_008304, partial [Entomortierella beljakovae]
MRPSIVTLTAILLPAIFAAKRQYAARHIITVYDHAFHPNYLEIKMGDVVEWNFQESGHNVVQGTYCVDGNVFTSGPVSSVTTWAFTFTQAG